MSLQGLKIYLLFTSFSLDLKVWQQISGCYTSMSFYMEESTLYIVADVSALVCIWGYDSMCTRDKGKHTALFLSRRQAQNIWDFATLCPVVWLLEKWRSGSPTTPPPWVLLELCKASGGPASAGSWISTCRKGMELFWDRWECLRDSSAQCFVLPLVWSMPIFYYFIYNVI